MHVGVFLNLLMCVCTPQGWWMNEGGEKRKRGRGNSTWSYRSPGVPSRRCCRQVWSSRSGLLAELVVRSWGPMMTWSLGSLTPPGHCRSSCAGMHPADPGPGWRLRRLLGGGAAEISRNRKTRGISVLLCAFSLRQALLFIKLIQV